MSHTCQEGSNNSEAAHKTEVVCCAWANLSLLDENIHFLAALHGYLPGAKNQNEFHNDLSLLYEFELLCKSALTPFVPEVSRASGCGCHGAFGN